MCALKPAKCALALLKKRKSSQLFFVFFVLNFKISFDGRVKITVIVATDLAHSIHLYQSRYLVFKWWTNAEWPLGFGVALLVLLLYFWKESKGFRCSCGPVGSCMLMAWLVCDFEIKASLILVRAGLKAVSSVGEGRQQKDRGGQKNNFFLLLIKEKINNH